MALGRGYCGRSIFVRSAKYKEGGDGVLSGGGFSIGNVSVHCARDLLRRVRPARVSLFLGDEHWRFFFGLTWVADTAVHAIKREGWNY